MWKCIMFNVLTFIILFLAGDVYPKTEDPATIRRNRMFKFALYQDLLVGFSILKMMVFEGCTISGVIERVRSSGAVTHLYLITVVALHGALLFDEPTDHRVRLNPAPYVPSALDQDKMKLFLL